MQHSVQSEAAFSVSVHYSKGEIMLALDRSMRPAKKK